MRRRLPWLPALAAALLGVTFLPSCNVGYILRSGYYQAELLASREPIEEVLADGRVSAGEEQRLRMIPEIKAYGRGLGLHATDNYDTLAVGWNRTIWNLAACGELSFEPRTWWFPVVGRVPYLGFFDQDDAMFRKAALEEEGWEVHIRTAGAYSTLGWFRDPVLPGMLRWSEADLAEVVFHELAHATLWIPGSVDFNESFANFVGEAAVRHYLVDRFGPEGAPVLAYDRLDRDSLRFEALLHGLYKDLDSVYTDPALTPDQKRSRKQALYASMTERVLASDIEDKDRWLGHLRRSPWNNARLMQFRTYNSNEDAFKVVYDRADGELARFIASIDEITRDKPDPFVALQSAATAVVQIP